MASQKEEFSNYYRGSPARILRFRFRIRPGDHRVAVPLIFLRFRICYVFPSTLILQGDQARLMLRFL